MIVMFVLFPRISGPLWGSPQHETSATTGLSERMTPGAVSQLARSRAVAFRASFPQDPPPKDQRYWRGPVLSFYDGRAWRRVEPLALPDVPRPGSPAAMTYEYEVTLEPHSQRWLLALDIPDSVPPGARLSPEYELIAEARVDRLLQYSLSSLADYRIDVELNEAEHRRYTQLPAAAAPRARSLVAQWQAQSQDPATLIARALTYFRTEPYVYTLEPPLLQGDPVDEFLFDTRRGFCEHYSSSFVVMMRAAGIPARPVTGYLGGEWNPLAGYMLVRQADAHAWAEVWLQGQGWVRIDPTAAVAPERIELGLDAALDELAGERGGGALSFAGHLRLRLSIALDTLDYYWNYWLVSFGPERQKALLERLGLAGLGLGTIAALMVGLVATIATIYALLAARASRTRPRDGAQALYERYCERLRRVGLPRAAWEGPRDYAARVSTQRPELAREAGDITRLYVDLRYGQARGEVLRELAARVRAFRPRKRKPAEAG
jgi:transglutaminase-like putative cysteine protease